MEGHSIPVQSELENQRRGRLVSVMVLYHKKTILWYTIPQSPIINRFCGTRYHKRGVLDRLRVVWDTHIIIIYHTYYLYLRLEGRLLLMGFVKGIKSDSKCDN